jgi:hypothetical protein
MVILLHRESAYEEDDPRQGEADFIAPMSAEPSTSRFGPTARSPR